MVANRIEPVLVTPGASHSRPRVSNDNAYAESLFRTLKYVPSWPSSGFLDLAEARRWVEGFSRWYNKEHRHSAIGYVTPEQRHQGEDISLLAKRKALYDMAKKARPERWSASCRQWQRVDVVMLNPDKSQETDDRNFPRNTVYRKDDYRRRIRQKQMDMESYSD